MKPMILYQITAKYSFFLDFNNIMVTTGYKCTSFECYSKGTEIINLQRTDNTCSKLRGYQIPVTSASGGLLNGKPVICGGQSAYKDTLNACYILENVHVVGLLSTWLERKWLSFVSMEKPRSGHSSVVINDKDGERLWIIGGLSDRAGHVTKKGITEYVFPNKTVSFGPILKKDALDMTWTNCMLALDNGSVIILGHGFPVIFNPEDKSFKKLSKKLDDPREKSACAMFNSEKHEKRPVIAVIGGLGGVEVTTPSNVSSSRVDFKTYFLDYTITHEWETGKGGKNSENTFIIIGTQKK